MKLEKALEKIFDMHQFDVKLGLSSIKNLLEYIGNPQKKITAIHVAGSNGKGSTSAYLASILIEAGYSVGLYTSPHFVKFNERVRVNGQMIPNEYIANFIEEMNDYIEEERPTFFEITTALAFKYFAEQNLDYVVLETGLGGRLDATNVIEESLASLITSISLEHTNILGNTIEDIACEKGGIIKSNSNLFIGKMFYEAEKVLTEIAETKNTKVYSFGNFASEDIDFIEVKLTQGNYRVSNTALKGYHQKLNAALAIFTLNKVLSIEEPFITLGINNVLKNSGIMGRYETVNQFPKVIFDAAHNLEGVSWFIKEFATEYENYEECNLIFGAMRDKEVGKMLEALNPYFNNIIFTAVEYERAFKPEELLKISEAHNIKAEITYKPEELIVDFIKKEKGKCLIVLGSIYLLGRIKEKLLI